MARGPNKANPWSAALVSERLQKLKQVKTRAHQPPSDEELARRHYQEAAAVVMAFDPAQLKPFDSTYRSASPAELLKWNVKARAIDDSGNDTGRGDDPVSPLEVQWTLLPDVRQAALRRLLVSGRAADAVAANPLVAPSAIGSMLRDTLIGQAPSMETLDYDALLLLRQIAEWLDGTRVAGLPSVAAIERELPRLRLRKSFEAAVGEHFQGRERQLQRLRDYIGILPPGNLAERFLRGVRNVSGWHERPPLMVYGPGGVGKSALLSKFALEHLDCEEDYRVPVVYIDFELDQYSIADPGTVLAEMVAQLALQYPNHDTAWYRLGEQIGYLSQATGTRERTLQKASSFESVAPYSSTERAEKEIFPEFAATFEAACDGRQLPLVVFLDTFERAQYQHPEWLTEFFAFFEALQSHVPRLRLVLAGRAPEDSAPLDNMLLGDLDDAAADGLLEALGVQDPALRALIFTEWGGNPLTLRLAARVVAQQKTLPELTDRSAFRRFWRKKVDAGQVQGMLTTRILDHIVDPDVRRLAHPGLVVRRITPAIIEHVLAKPCGVAVPDTERAQVLFHALKRETSLVAVTEAGALRHLPELRKVMLPQLLQAQPAVVASINRRAIAHYKMGERTEDRAEELYHRLLLQQRESTLDARFDPQAAELLRPAIDELPPESQAYLANRLDGLSLPDTVWKASEQSEWERHTARAVRRSLKSGDTERASQRLYARARDHWLAGSELFLLEIEVHMAAGDYDAARERLEFELQADASPAHRFELLMMQGFVERHLSHPDEAADRFEEALALARSARLDAQDQLRAAVAALEASADDGTRRADLLRVVRGIVAELPNRALANAPSLSRRLGAAVGADDIKVLARVIGAGALPPLGAAELDSLQTVIHELTDATNKDPTGERRLRTHASRLRRLTQGKANPNSMSLALSELLQDASDSDDGAAVSELAGLAARMLSSDGS